MLIRIFSETDSRKHNKAREKITCNFHKKNSSDEQLHLWI